METQPRAPEQQTLVVQTAALNKPPAVPQLEADADPTTLTGWASSDRSHLHRRAVGRVLG